MQPRWSRLSLAEWMREPRASLLLSQGINPDPVRLLRPGAAPLSAMAMLGKDIFYDPGLSSSGRLSCASCHDARQAYGPSGALPAMLGGPSLMQQGMRAVPSLMYLERQPNFSIGPDNAENENVNIAAMAAQGAGTGHAAKSAERASAAANLVPQGGLFWDGRADTLQNQAMSPLTGPFEMEGGSVAVVATRLARSASCMCSSASKRRPRSCSRSVRRALKVERLSTVINSTPSMRLMRRASLLPMIHVSWVVGHACCKVRTSGTTWQVSPIADSLRMQTLRGASANGNIMESGL